MPNPSQIKASQINDELSTLGYTVNSTDTISMGNNWVRNVTTQSTGSVSFGKARWGINFPGRDHTPTFSYSFYNNNSKQNITVFSFGFSGFHSSAGGEIQVSFLANGQMQLHSASLLNSSTENQNTFYRTWLTSGSAGDYTIQMAVSSGSFDSGSSINTDLALSTNRSWFFNVSTTGGYVSQTATGNIIMKSSGTEFFRRPFNYFAEAELQ